MAATVLSGTGNVSYTNNTGQNVRIITNYLKAKENILYQYVGRPFASKRVGWF